ncbi:uncharacterized protein LOC142230646 isoform X1 [Haematobia irritans]|uniref:uncharacterized protein LOC142230646 isoform X1 n=1 Tax=Haematobia irritans TaxID=7368 RepID=UPI003F4F92C7
MDNQSTCNLDELVTNLLGNFNTLLDCPARFCGTYGGQKIQQFIEYVKTYKRIKCINDAQALQELGYLLTEHAHLWWLRRKCHFTTWCEALTALQNQYTKQRPAYLIYKDIFEHKFEDYTEETEFIDDKYELLSELADPKQNEQNKLDMIFGLLPNNIQAKLEYVKILNVAELKRQILNIKGRKSATTEGKNSESHDVTKALSNAKRKHDSKGLQVENVATSASNHVETLCSTSTNSTNSNDKEPVIKVRRTEDLMPHVKIEEKDISSPQSQEEFISTASVSPINADDNTNFQIDVDIMNQINHIIDESEMNCDNLCDTTVQIQSTLMPITETPTTTIGFLLNGETTIQAEVSKKPHPAVRAAVAVSLPKKQRCSYCRKYNHIAQDCLKRLRHMELFPEKFIKKPKEPVEITTNNNKDSSMTEQAETTNNNNNSNVNPSTTENITTTTPTTTSPPSFNSDVPAPTISIPQQNVASTTTTSTPIVNHSISLAQVSTTFSHHINTTTSSIFPLTTKLIAPINGPSPSKQLAAKLRGINRASLKCHQCGTVGFYKSICPNCSPIYNSQKM